MNRYRFTDGRSDASVIKKDYTTAGSLVSSSELVSPVRKASGEFRSINDVSDSSFLSRQKRGLITMHPVVLRREERNSSPSNWSYGVHPIWGRRTIIGDIGCLISQNWSAPSWYNSDVVSAQSQSLIRCFAKAKSPDVQAAVTAAEGQKTVNGILRPLEQARELAFKVLSRKRNLVARGLTGAKAAASAWLEYRYGWRPLMADIDGSIQALRNSGYMEPQRLTARDGTTLKWSTKGKITPSVSGTTSVEASYARYIEHKISAGLIYELYDGSYTQYLKRSLGLSLGDVPSTVWELVPYSFVIDWFTEIGPWLQAIKPLPGFKVLGNWVTTHETSGQEYTNLSSTCHVANSPATTYSASGGGYSEKFEVTTRSVDLALPSMPAATVSFRSLTHSIDAAALILSRISGNMRQLRI
jgi:hypothetical protein